MNNWEEIIYDYEMKSEKDWNFALEYITEELKYIWA